MMTHFFCCDSPIGITRCPTLYVRFYTFWLLITFLLISYLYICCRLWIPNSLHSLFPITGHLYVDFDYDYTVILFFPRLRFYIAFTLVIMLIHTFCYDIVLHVHNYWLYHCPTHTFTRLLPFYGTWMLLFYVTLLPFTFTAFPMVTLHFSHDYTNGVILHFYVTFAPSWFTFDSFYNLFPYYDIHSFHYLLCPLVTFSLHFTTCYTTHTVLLLHLFTLQLRSIMISLHFPTAHHSHLTAHYYSLHVQCCTWLLIPITLRAPTRVFTVDPLPVDDVFLFYRRTHRITVHATLPSHVHLRCTLLQDDIFVDHCC